jgi:LuxR family maltose regulon positive regulatory protein
VDPARIILTPKLRAPSPRPEQIVRPRLLGLLEGALDRKISLISAPAGYGKTTLLAQWQQAEVSRTFCWLGLDEQDNDPVRMWMHIVAAIRQLEPEDEDFGADALMALSSLGQNLSQITLPMLINDFAGLPHRTVIVLDDYQCITNNSCHDSVAFFLEHFPENVHLVVASRSDPPLPLGRLRARGEMNEIRTEHLAFSEEEATCLLNEKMGLDISPEDLSVLLERTEGWPAGLYLAALSLRNMEDRHDFIASFGGSDHYIVDLLGEEVMARLSEEMREFLLRTSILRRMTGTLCDAVVGREGSGDVLRELARSNLFVVSLSGQGEWYRYHQLFSEFLFYTLASSRPDLVPILCGRASSWLEGVGAIEGAVRYAIAAEDYERAGLLVTHHWYSYVLTGQTKTVEDWLELLPEALSTHDPALLLVKAWIHTLSGRSEEAERLLAIAESLPSEGPLPDGTASVEAGVATLRAVFGIGGIQYTLEAARRAAAMYPGQTSPQAALISFGLGSGLYLSGETSAARQKFEEVLELTESGQPLLRMVSLSYLSIVAADKGHPGEAESLAREAHALVGRFGLQGVPQSSWAPIALGYYLAKRGDLVKAQTALEDGLSTRRRLPGLSPWPTLIGLLALAPVHASLGDRGGARELLAEARTILEPFADDAGIFPELLERQERRLHKTMRRDGSLDEELTERELNVLRRLIGDSSITQIAKDLYVSPNTVRTQVKSIYRKLGVSSRREAVEEARARGLI